MVVVRWLLPGALCVVGVVFLLRGGETDGAVGVMALGIALIVWVFVGAAALTRRSGSDREAEAAARDEFSRTGRWPHDRDADG